MSWSSAPSFASAAVGRPLRALAVAGLFAVSGLLGACSDGSGFRPMYGALGTAGETDQRLAQVDFAPIPGRVGQRLRNELVFQGKRGDNRGETDLPPGYRLEVVLKETLTSTLIARTGEASSQIYMLDASFRLIRLQDKKVVLQGESFGRAGFERFSSIYSNVRAREDAENRAAKTIADDVKGRLATYLSNPA